MQLFRDVSKYIIEVCLSWQATNSWRHHHGHACDHRQVCGLTDFLLLLRGLGPDFASEKVIALGLVRCNSSENVSKYNLEVC